MITIKKRKVVDDTREQAIDRALELREDIIPYLEACKNIETGMIVHERFLRTKKKILNLLGGSEQNWRDWKWQMKNRIHDASLLAKILEISEDEKKRIDKVGNVYRWAISPYYLSLIGPDYRNNPVYKLAVPSIRELESGGCPDPMNEALTSPAPRVTRRYPDRLIINVTNQCATFCRHCQRRRNISELDRHSTLDDIEKALAYVHDNPEIRDVLITGGDALLLSDRTLEWILRELQGISHVEIKRIGTRVPVTLPQRVTPELVSILRRYPPLYLNTQFNHPLEVTPEAKQACDRLAEAGIVLGNQAVLLHGVNDSPYVMRKLNQELLRIRVRPYYIFHAKDVVGTRHWKTSIQTGLDIMESLIGHTSGLAIPQYIVNAPGGWGKIPLSPNYILDIQPDKTVLQSWEGKAIEIPEDNFPC